MTDRDELAKSDLRMQRSLLARDQLRILLAEATATVAGNRRKMQELKARIARRSLAASRAARSVKALKALKALEAPKPGRTR